MPNKQQKSDEQVLVHLTKEQWNKMLQVEHATKGKVNLRAMVLNKAKTGDRQGIIDLLRQYNINVEE